MIKPERVSTRWTNRRVLIALAGLLAVPVLILIVMGRFNGLYGQDPYAYFDYAMGPLRESILNFKPIPPFFWPPGYPLLVSALSLPLGVSPLIGQGISMAAGAITPFFVYLLAKEIWWHAESEPYGPLLAGLLCACTGQLWQSSAVVMADTTGLATASFAGYALVRYGKRPAEGTQWLTLAASGFAFAILTRWAYALPAIPATLYALYHLRKAPRWLAAKQAALAGGAVLLILSPLIPSLLARGIPGAGIEPAFVGDLDVYHWNLATALRNSHQTTDGLLEYRLPNGLFYVLAPAHRFYFTALIAPLLIPGVWSALRQLDFDIWLILLGWPAIVYLFHAGTPWQNFRFTLVLLPPLALLAAAGSAVIRARIPMRFRMVHSIYLLSGLTLMVSGGWRLTKNHIGRNVRDLEVAQRVEETLDPGSQLITFGITQTIRHNTAVETHEIFTLDSVELEALVREAQPTFLLLDVANVEQQWRGMAPETSYRWLLENRRLIQFDRFDRYTLFKVRSSS